MTTTTASLLLHGYWNGYSNDKADATHATLRTPQLATREEAEAVTAALPKALRLHVVSCSNLDGSTTWTAQAHIRLAADGANGGRNEAGIKRLRTALRAGAVYSIPEHPARNSYLTLEAFTQAAGI